MTASVRLSLRAAKAISDGKSGDCLRAWEELRAAIAQAERKSATRRKLAEPKRAKRAARKESWDAVKKAVLARSGGCCEACGVRPFSVWLDPDHFFGKARAPETVATVWHLCRTCHEAKHAGNPSPEAWHRRFIEHCTRHGYTSEAARARARLAFVTARGAP